MTSRLDRLFILLETGTNTVTKQAAAEQLGEAQRLHPHELHHLLARVSILLKSSQWDTRISAAHAVKAIISQVPIWDPKPIESLAMKDELNEPLCLNQNNKLDLENFDIMKVLAQSSHLTGSEGTEYDLMAEGDTVPMQNHKIIAAKLGLENHLVEGYTSDLFTSSDLTAVVSISAEEKLEVKTSIKETLQQTAGLSRREMNRAKRKARQTITKQRSRDIDEGSELGNSSNVTSKSLESSVKKIKSEDNSGSWYNSNNDIVGDPRCAVPESTSCWPDSAIDWPLEAFAESLLQDLFSSKWEVRHGAATALRELIRLQGLGAGKSKKQTKEEMEEGHRKWLIDVSLRLLCVLGIDRFGDFISDQVVAPVRETCAQALGSLVLLISKKNESKAPAKTYEDVARRSKSKNKEKEQYQQVNKDIMGLLNIMLNLLEHSEWEARHGALLALKYLLAIRTDLLGEFLPKTFPAIMKGLSDSVEDVGAMAASALIPIAADLPKFLDPVHLEAIVSKLWQLLKDQDDLAAACNSFMGLLASILSQPAARTCLNPQPLSVVLPRLWPFLSHSSSSVRKATLQTLETLCEEGELGSSSEPNPKEDCWHDTVGKNSREAILQEALRHVFERVLIEHITSIQEVAERVWEKLVVLSELELLLHAACPLVSTWLCLAMQPEHVPFNSALLMNVQSQKYGRFSFQQQQHQTVESTQGAQQYGPMPPLPLKVYIGGVETVTQSTRHFNVVRARCMATRMLGLLSAYVVKPAPRLIYNSEVPSPSLCYAKVLLAHLHSRSALQRTVVALTMAHWASLDPDRPPQIPDILRRQLFVCLNGCIYYDEIAGSVTRLLHECRDYMATLKHYKFTLPIEVNTSGIMTLEQIAAVAMTPAILCTGSTPLTSQQQQNANIKLKPKLLESLEERRRGLELGAAASSAQQQALHVSTQAALAGAATMLRCLPEPPQPLNPLVKPLMESIKREEHEQFQRLAAKHLANLVNLCVARTPCPNSKIVTNLCTFLCSDAEFTPRVVSSEPENDPFNGILTLNNRQKNAERQAYNRGNVNGLNGNRGPGRPPATDIPLEEILSYEEPEAKAARVRRQGATFALTAIAALIGKELPKKLAHLWNLMLPECLQNYNTISSKNFVDEEANNLVFSLQVLEVILPSLECSLLLPIIECLDNMCLILTNPYKSVRHMASRCIAVLAMLNTKETMNCVVPKITTLLETSSSEVSKIGPSEVDTRRQGAAEALACLVDSLGVSVVPYAVLFMVPLLGRMSDQNQAVRLICSATFATLVQLLPLDPGAIDASYLAQERAQEKRFLEQLLNPRSIPDTQLNIPVNAELRSYQQQGLNWLNFLNRYQLHGVLCDDMGLGKTLQTLCILALDHYRNKQAPSSLVICPPTLTGHWVYEAEKFFHVKNLSVIQYAGNPLERERLRCRVAYFKLVVASYDIVRKDIDFFESIQWNYCVLDEGHIIKNGKTKCAKAVKKLHAHHRLILSGTPVQNDVLELWSLFDFLMPGFLGSEKQFAAKYSRPILACRETKAGAKEQEAGALAMEALHRQVLPFLLRRNKEDVLKDLPPKITQDYYCDLSLLQKSLYEDFKLQHSATLINNTIAGGRPSNGHVFEALRYLRNVCNHPKLVLTPKHPQYQKISNMLKEQHSSLADIEHGAKLPALKQLLLDCGIGFTSQQSQQNQVTTSTRTCINTVIDSQQSQGQLVSQHRALIFCQLKAMLDIIEHDLLRIHLPTVTYLRLDGSVPAAQRYSIVARFNADPSFDVLLLTTQVGGLGLNLTGADTVIFVEHDWNPMKDLQAMDRAHRIGQKKVVNVYRLITRQTLEEKIMSLQKFKLLTANTIISTENSSLETMRTEQLLDLFSLDSDKNSRNEYMPEIQDNSKVTEESGINRSIVGILPELWEQQQYDDEYDLESFLITLKSDTTSANVNRN